MPVMAMLTISFQMSFAGTETTSHQTAVGPFKREAPGGPKCMKGATETVTSAVCPTVEAPSMMKALYDFVNPEMLNTPGFRLSPQSRDYRAV